MRLDSFYPVLLTDDVEAGSRFLIEHFGFRATFRSDWYVSLAHGGGPDHEIAFVLRTHTSVPSAYRTRTNVLLNMEVDDATREYERARAAGLEVVVPLRDEPWGQRHFVGVAPGGLLLDVIEVIPPDPEFAAKYV